MIPSGVYWKTLTSCDHIEREKNVLSLEQEFKSQNRLDKVLNNPKFWVLGEGINPCNREQVESYAYSGALKFRCSVLKELKISNYKFPQRLLISAVDICFKEFSNLLAGEIDTYDNEIGVLPALVFLLCERHTHGADFQWSYKSTTNFSEFLQALFSIFYLPNLTADLLHSNIKILSDVLTYFPRSRVTPLAVSIAADLSEVLVKFLTTENRFVALKCVYGLSTLGLGDSISKEIPSILCFWSSSRSIYPSVICTCTICDFWRHALKAARQRDETTLKFDGDKSDMDLILNSMGKSTLGNFLLCFSQLEKNINGLKFSNKETHEECETNLKVEETTQNSEVHTSIDTPPPVAKSKKTDGGESLKATFDLQSSDKEAIVLKAPTKKVETVKAEEKKFYSLSPFGSYKQHKLTIQESSTSSESSLVSFACISTLLSWCYSKHNHGSSILSCRLEKQDLCEFLLNRISLERLENPTLPLLPGSRMLLESICGILLQDPKHNVSIVLRVKYRDQLQEILDIFLCCRRSYDFELALNVMFGLCVVVLMTDDGSFALPSQILSEKLVAYLCWVTEILDYQRPLQIENVLVVKLLVALSGVSCGALTIFNTNESRRRFIPPANATCGQLSTSLRSWKAKFPGSLTGCVLFSAIYSVVENRCRSAGAVVRTNKIPFPVLSKDLFTQKNV
eukprot:GHVP01009313.1.p1 GENE.GHVP01009313.1~~GHVP01009313.1.p1  ORF type:complete len:681 (+),score=116.48 GHVP01009313.1:1180-3222(+)